MARALKSFIYGILFTLTMFCCKMEKQKILTTIYDFYPRGIEIYSIEYPDRPETKRLKKLLEDPIKKNEANSFFIKLIDKFGSSNVDNMTLFGWGNPCYHFRVTAKNNQNYETIIIFISIISDYYYIYIHDDVERKKHLLDGENYKLILGILKNIFPFYEELSPRLAQQIVPDIMLESKDFGEVSILNCLFTDHIY